VSTRLNSGRFLGFPIAINHRLYLSIMAREHPMVERRTDHATRKRVSEMSTEEMQQALLVSERTGLPNKRAFDEREPSAWVAMCDVNGLKTLNDVFGYSAGDILIRKLAEVLTSVKVDAYHDKGDEFLCRGSSYQELNQKLSRAQRLLQEKPFAVRGMDGRTTSVPGADFCFGIGTNLEEAERSLKHQKELRKWRFTEWQCPSS